MNKIYKVIWSKAKHTYVVASEIAKGHTKGETTGKGLKKLAAAMLVAAALLSPSFAWAADATTKFEPAANQASNTAVAVYTKDEADSTFATQDQLQKDVAATNELLTKKADQTALDETNANLAKKADQTALEATNVNLAKKADQTALDETNANLAKKANQVDLDGKADKATTLEGYGITNAYTKDEADGKFATVDQLQADVAATNEELAKKADKATTLAGYGITDAYTKDEVDKADTKLQSAIDEEARKRKYSVTNLENADKQLQTNIDNEAADRKAADTALQASVDTNTNDIADLKKADTTLQTNIDNEAAARKEADNTLQTNIDNEKTAREAADVEEKAGRVAADTKLVDATNGGLSLGDGNVLQTNTTKIDAATGEVTTSKTAAKEMILNKGDKQITLNENGIKVGTNSSVVDKDGVYTGGDNYIAAQAAMRADGSIKGAGGDFTVDGTNGNVNTKGSVSAASGTIGNVSMSADGTVTGVKDLNASGKVTAGSFTDGTATMSNGSLNGVNQINATGNIVTTGNMKAHDITAEGKIKGETINGNTGTFGSLTTTGNASVGGTLTTNGIINTGNATTDMLTVNHNATVGGNLGVTGDITGKSLDVGSGDIKGGQITGTGLNVGAGTIKTTGAVETGTLTTTGKADIGGDLTVKGKLNVDEIDLTKSGIVDDNQVTASTKVAAGEITSYKKATNTKDGSEKESAIDYDEKGTSTWAKSTDADGNNWNKSTLTVEGNDVTSKVVDSKGNTNESKQTVSASNSSITGTVEGKYYKSYITQNLKKILQGIQNGTNESTVDQTETGIKSTATDGKNTASTNLSNGGFNTYATDGTNKTYTKQTARDIKNTAENGTISNSAKDLVNKATGDMTNTVGGKLLNDVTGDMENKVGGKLTTTVTGKTTENYNGGLETTVTGEEKHTVNGNQTNIITGTQTTTVTGDVTEDYKANLSTTVGGNQTTTVTGDSSLTAEDIKNEAKNRITNKALDVETDASSSIVNKVSNEYGSNTSTQLSYQTTEEMSQADGKTASYLRGAAEEKSQLTDGAKKTTIDTIAGQTNTNITEGKNISNSLQKADQAASSVTDGTNTTVVNQDAKSLASSITDGTRVNNTSSTVDASVQRIQTDDTHYSVSSKSASKMEDALFNGSTVIDSLKDAEKGLVSTAVTDGTNLTGSSMTAKGITNSAAESIVNEIGDGSKVKSEMTAEGITNTANGGKITNDAKDVLNKGANSVINEVGNNQVAVTTDSVKAAYGSDTSTTWDAKGITSATSGDMENRAKSILNQVGEKTSWKMTDGTVVESVKDASGKTNQTTTTAADTYQFVKNGDNTLAKRTSSTNDNLNITDGTNTYTKITTATGNKQTVTDGTETASTNLTKSASNTLIENGTQSVLDHMAADTSYTVMNEKGNGSRRQQTASEILDRVTDGTNTSEVKQTASEVATSAKNITNTAETIKDVAGKTTVTTTDTGTTFENTAHSTAIEEGTVTKTTISGNTLETGKATMDYADVMKDLGVHGKATIDGDTSVGGNLSVTGTSTLTGDVTMGSNATVEKDLTVKGTTTTDKLVVSNGATISGGTTTDKLKVTGSSEFGGAATFNDIVKMNKGLSVTGGVTADTVTAVSYTVKDTTIKIDKEGINAGGTKVTGLAPADISNANSTDAVSGGQLYETNTRVSGLETRMGTVETKVDKLDNKIDKVGANAAAMANLHPLEFDEDSKWNIAAAVGSSGSETASAVGVFYRPNENVMVNASVAMGTGENMFGGGVSLRLGHGGNKAKEAQMKAAAKENRELRAKVDDLTARMDALLSVLNPNMSKDFPDVPENHWAYEAVSRLAGNGIVEGYEDGKYHGERQMTRYEMAEIIYNALSKGAKAEKKLVEEFRPELQAMAAQKKA